MRPTPTHDQVVHVRNGLEALCAFFIGNFVTVFVIARWGAGVEGLWALAISFLFTLIATIAIGLVLRPKKISTMLCGAGLTALLSSLPPAIINEFYIEIEINKSPIKIGWSDANSVYVLLLGIFVCAILLALAHMQYAREHRIESRKSWNQWREEDTKPIAAQKETDEQL